MSTSPEAGIKPVEKQIKVRLNQEAAFQLFTEGLGRWWPLSSYSVGMEKAESCHMEGHVGGRIFEVMENGEESEWGRVTEWDPPETVAFEWYPGRTSETAQQVSIRFTAADDGTLLELVHTGWETLEARAEATRGGYDSGWDFVLGQFTEATANQD